MELRLAAPLLGPNARQIPVFVSGCTISKASPSKQLVQSAEPRLTSCPGLNLLGGEGSRLMPSFGHVVGLRVESPLEQSFHVGGVGSQASLPSQETILRGFAFRHLSH